MNVRPLNKHVRNRGANNAVLFDGEVGYLVLEMPHGGETVFASFDAERWDEISSYRWYLSRNGKTHYVVANAFVNGKRRLLQLHQYLLGTAGCCPAGLVCDHRDQCGFSNLSSNLRLVSHRENSLNRRDYHSTSA